MTARQVLATLAHPLAQWPTTIAQWSTNGAVPIELRACLSVGELEAVTATGIRPLVVLLDGGSNRIDEHAIAAVARCGSVPVGVAARETMTDWDRLGVTRVLHAEFTPADLMDLLDTVGDDDPSARSGSEDDSRGGSGSGDFREGVSDPVDLGARHSAPHGSAPNSTAGSVFTEAGRRRSGAVISVCGPGGCGASVISMAIAQGIALDPASENSKVLLVDGARRTHQALYHHTGDVLPAIGDLVNRVRSGTTGLDDLERGTFGTSRGYRILAGAPTPASSPVSIPGACRKPSSSSPAATTSSWSTTTATFPVGP